MFVHNAQLPIAILLEDMGYASILQMLLVFFVSCCGKLGHLFRVELQEISSDAAIGAEKLNVDDSNIGLNFRCAGQIFALSPENDEARWLGTLGSSTEYRRAVGLETLPLVGLLGSKQLPKCAHCCLDLSRAELDL